MNDTQWLFELESLYAKEEQRYEEIQVLSEVARKGLVSILGLNLMPVEEDIPLESIDEEYVGAIGGERILTKLRHPKDHEFLPLSILMGREEIIAEIIKRQQELHDQEELDSKEESGEIVHMTPEELDAFMNDGVDEGDMVFLEDAVDLEKQMIWQSEEIQKINKALVKPMSDKDNDLLELDEAASNRRPIKEIKKRSRVTLD
jgi:hypothetical protein